MKELKKLTHILLGIFLVLIGMAGVILPVLDGLTFLILGLILISFESKYVEYRLNNLAHKTTFTGDWYEKLLKFMKKLFKI